MQVFLPFNTGPALTISSAWIFVNSGVAGIGTGNGGNTGLDVFTTTTGQWEFLQAPNGVAPANEFIIYSSGGPADFFAELVVVEAVPEPTTIALLALGLLGIAVQRRRGTRH